MEKWLGWDTLQRIMSTHFARWQFKHPKPKDFFDIANEVSGRDLNWFFDQVHRSSNAFDYGIQELRSAAEGGRFRTEVVVRRYGEAIFPIDVLVTFENGETVTEHWNGSDRWQAVRLRPRLEGALGRRRSRPCPAARRERDEQLQDAPAEGPGDRDEMVAQVDGVAAGLPALVERS